MSDRPHDPSEESRNRLLAALRSEDLDRLRPHLKHVELAHRHVLQKAGTAIEYVYFPLQGMVSLVRQLEDGVEIEVGIVGNEGMVGVPVVLGIGVMPCEAMAQLPGAALRLPVDVLRAELARSPELNALLLRYAQAFFIQVSQSVACNGRHTLEQRLARWMLMAHDCVEGDELLLSHEFLAMMLARRRAGVTTAVGALKSAGIISNSHGRIVIRDRKGLEAAACECYRTVKQEQKHLLP
jgi:CRP-like cAMP-binding protein